MTEVLRKNFEEQLPLIKKSIESAAFIAIDTEFSGLMKSEQLRHSLFDLGKERYEKLRQNVSQFVIIQVGIACFIPGGQEHEYNVDVYVFYTCPHALADVDPLLCFQSSSLRFLCQHGFDFNKLIYEGIPYLTTDQEDQVTDFLEDDSFIKTQKLSPSQMDERGLQQLCEQLSTWLQTAAEGDTKVLEEGSQVLPSTILQMEIRKRFQDIWTTEDGRYVTVTKVSKRDSIDELDTSLKCDARGMIDTFVGFSRVFKMLVSSQRPIVGHNCLMDILLMFNQFHKPLPRTYNQFKKEVSSILPTIYDTKFIGWQLKRALDKTDPLLFETTELLSLYKALNKQNHVFLYSPILKLRGEGEKYDKEEKPHEAGFDAFIAGGCLLKMAHLSYWRKRQDKTARLVSFTEYIYEFRQYKNCINMARASISYMNLGGDDPVSVRPAWLIVKTQTLNLQEITTEFSKYGNVDVLPWGRGQAIVALPNHAVARRLLEAYSNSKKIVVCRYSHIKHSKILSKCLRYTAVFLGLIGIGLLYHSYEPSPPKPHL